MSEDQLKQKIAAFFKERGIFYCRIAQGARSNAGVPDFFAAANGGAFWIEAKRPGRYKDLWEGCKRDSPAQYDFLRRASLAGCVALVVDSLAELATYFPISQSERGYK